MYSRNNNKMLRYIYTKCGNDEKLRKNILIEEWPFEIGIQIKKTEKSHIAFGSGQDRNLLTFGPRNPNDDEKRKWSLAPEFSFQPGTINCSKFKSKVGYGIGGLSAQRFKSNNINDTPAPNTYFKEVTFYPPLKKSTKNVSGISPEFAFNTSLRNCRGRIEKKYLIPGVGTYNLFGGPSLVCPCPKIPKKGNEIKTIPFLCTQNQVESCHYCGQKLFFDYYRSRNEVKMKHFEDENEGEVGILAICRNCFCDIFKRGGQKGHGYRGQFSRSSKDSIDFFEKVRNCSFIHNHFATPFSIDKTNCKLIKKLKQKEAYLGKYFKDTDTDGCPLNNSYINNIH